MSGRENLFCNADADCDGEKVCVPWLGINDAITVNGNTVIKACSLPRNLDEYCINGQHNHCSNENLCGQNFQVAAIAQDYGKCQKPIDYCNSSTYPLFILTLQKLLQKHLIQRRKYVSLMKSFFFSHQSPMMMLPTVSMSVKRLQVTPLVETFVRRTIF